MLNSFDFGEEKQVFDQFGAVVLFCNSFQLLHSRIAPRNPSPVQADANVEIDAAWNSGDGGYASGRFPTDTDDEDGYDPDESGSGSGMESTSTSESESGIVGLIFLPVNLPDAKIEVRARCVLDCADLARLSGIISSGG